MATYRTVFGSLEKYEKGTIEIINDDPKHYVYSNIFEVVAKAPPYEKIAVAKNLEYVIEAVRAEGRSPWMACAHDEFVVVMDGEVEIELVKLDRAPAALADSPEVTAPPGARAGVLKAGAVLLEGDLTGKKMGIIRLGRGHQALLPRGAAYRFNAARPSAMIQQTLKGDLTVEKWRDICFR
jgi:hypothetical protein